LAAPIEVIGKGTNIQPIPEFSVATRLDLEQSRHDSEVVRARENRRPAWAPSTSVLAKLGILATIVAVFIGPAITQQDEWLLIIYGIMTLPALIAAMVRSARKSSDSYSRYSVEFIANMLASTAMVGAILAVLGMAVLIALWVTCTVAVSNI